MAAVLGALGGCMIVAAVTLFVFYIPFYRREKRKVDAWKKWCDDARKAITEGREVPPWEPPR